MRNVGSQVRRDAPGWTSYEVFVNGESAGRFDSWMAVAQYFEELADDDFDDDDEVDGPDDTRWGNAVDPDDEYDWDEDSEFEYLVDDGDLTERDVFNNDERCDISEDDREADDERYFPDGYEPPILGGRLAA